MRGAPEDLTGLLALGTAKDPVVLFLLPSMDLADFSKAANVYADPASGHSHIPHIKVRTWCQMDALLS